MTKTLIQTVVLVTCIGGFWISISTKLDTNSDASIALIKSIDARTTTETEKYKTQENAQTQELVATVNQNQDQIKTGIEQNKATLAKLEDLANRFNDLGQQIKAISEQNTVLLQEMSQVLNQHTKTLEKASQRATEAAQAAKTNQVKTQRAIREITKPKKSWWQYLTP